MDLQTMLEDALTKIDAMSIDEFEAMCIRAGYKPKRKPRVFISSSDNLDIGVNAQQLTYKKGSYFSDQNQTPSGFGFFMQNDIYPLVA